MAPVEFIPAAIMNRAPMVRTPGLLNPLRESSRGASLKVIVRVRAPMKMAAGGSLLKISRPKVSARINDQVDFKHDREGGNGCRFGLIIVSA